MKKLSFIILLVLFISGCSTTPPSPKKPTGKWQPINTTINEIKANTP